jgi:hypothetical protein
MPRCMYVCMHVLMYVCMLTIDRRTYLELLGDILGCTAHTADGQEHVVAEEVRSQALDLFREGGREHKRLSVARHIYGINTRIHTCIQTYMGIYYIYVVMSGLVSVCTNDAMNKNICEWACMP